MPRPRKETIAPADISPEAQHEIAHGFTEGDITYIQRFLKSYFGDEVVVTKKTFLNRTKYMLLAEPGSPKVTDFLENAKKEDSLEGFFMRSPFIQIVFMSF